MSLWKRGKYYYMDFLINGKRFCKSTRKTNRREAYRVQEEERRKAEKEMSMDSKVFNEMPTLSQAAKKMYEDRWSKNRDGVHPYRNVLYLAEQFGDPKLHEINSPWVYNVKVTLAKTREDSTVNRYLANLRTLLRTAFREWEVIDKLPNIVLFREKNRRTRIITRKEQKQLTDLLRNNTKYVERRWYWPLVADLVDFLCDTGCRLGEALNLNSENMETRGIIRLYPEDTKNSGVRSIPLSKRSQEIIDKLGKEPFKSIDSFQADRAFKWAKKEMKIEDPAFTLHACRHTFASRLVDVGEVNLYVIKNLLGHDSIKTTERYTHLIVDKLQEAVQKLENHKENKTDTEDPDNNNKN